MGCQISTTLQDGTKLELNTSMASRMVMYACSLHYERTPETHSEFMSDPLGYTDGIPASAVEPGLGSLRDCVDELWTDQRHSASYLKEAEAAAREFLEQCLKRGPGYIHCSH